MRLRVLVDGKFVGAALCGRPRGEIEFEEGFTIKDLLAHLDLDEGLFWVAKNRAMLKRDTYDHITLEEEDVIEIFRIMSGG